MNSSNQNQSPESNASQDPRIVEIVHRAQAWLDARRASHPPLEGRAPRVHSTGSPQVHPAQPTPGAPAPSPLNSAEPAEPNLPSQQLPVEPEASSGRAQPEPNPSASEPSPSAPGQSSPPSQLTSVQLHMIAVLKERASSQSPLDRLPVERQQLILELLEDYPAEAVASAISLPEQLGGWGIATSRPSINRFAARVKQNLRRQARAAASRNAEDFLREHANNPDAFLRAADQHLKLRLYEISQDADASASTVADLYKIIGEIRKLDLAERKLNQNAA